MFLLLLSSRSTRYTKLERPSTSLPMKNIHFCRPARLARSKSIPQRYLKFYCRRKSSIIRYFLFPCNFLTVCRDALDVSQHNSPTTMPDRRNRIPAQPPLPTPHSNFFVAQDKISLKQRRKTRKEAKKNEIFVSLSQCLEILTCPSQQQTAKHGRKGRRENVPHVKKGSLWSLQPRRKRPQSPELGAANMLHIGLSGPVVWREIRGTSPQTQGQEDL